MGRGDLKGLSSGALVGVSVRRQGVEVIDELFGFLLTVWLYRYCTGRLPEGEAKGRAGKQRALHRSANLGRRAAGQTPQNRPHRLTCTGDSRSSPAVPPVHLGVLFLDGGACLRAHRGCVTPGLSCRAKKSRICGPTTSAWVCWTVCQALLMINHSALGT